MIRFNLHDSNETTSSIRLVINNSRAWRSAFRYPVGYTVPVKFWSRKNMRATRAYPYHLSLNAVLDGLESYTKKVIAAYRARGAFPTKEQLRAELDEFFHPSPAKETDFLAHYQALMERKRPEWKENTYITYGEVLKRLKRWQKSIHIDDVNQRWLDDFRRHIMQDNSQYTAHFYAGFVARVAKDLGIYLKVKGKKPVNQKPYLTKQEREQWQAAEVAPDQEKYRDIFTLRCEIGLRISDSRNISSDRIQNIDGRKWLVTYTQKREVDAMIPLSSTAIDIIEKYDYELPEMPHYVRINYHLKKIAKAAGLDRPVQFVKNGKAQYVPLWQRMSTHVARTTFITQARIDGIADRAIMKFVGIKNRATLDRYDVSTALDYAKQYADYFK